jgi:hypothetical protein
MINPSLHENCYHYYVVLLLGLDPYTFSCKCDYLETINKVSDVRKMLSGDMAQRLCTPAEAKFYFRSLFNSKGEKNLFLKTNINCGLTSWAPGCEPGWGCSAGSNPVPGNNNGDSIPPRTTDCQPCCEGFFCPRGLTCMLREFFRQLPQNNIIMS